MIRRKIQILKQHCAVESRDPRTIQKSVNLPFAMTGDPSEVESNVATVAAQRMTTPEEVKPGILWGTPDQVIRQVEAYRAAGIGHIVLSLRAPYDLVELVRFGREVVPAVRERVAA
jgi:alkanesulfonate monooxygenase SsuD/methylene tetrahydromethanopterin reductase-like flavin-dependent oxidoreductase (luciferase family)